MRQDSGWLMQGGPFRRRPAPPRDRGRHALPRHAQQSFGTELVRSVVVMAATLAVWGLALLVESYGHQHVAW